MSDFGGKNVQIRPRPHMGSLQQRSSAGRAYSAPPDPSLYLRGPTSKRGEGGRKGGSKRSLGPQSLPHIDAPGHTL